MLKRQVLWIAIGALMLLALTPTVARATGIGDYLEQDETAINVLWTALAPVVAIATATERILEMFWERWEKIGAWPNDKGVVDTSSADYIAKKKAGSHWIGTAIAIVAVGLTNVRFFRLLGLDVLFSSMMLFDAGIGGIFDEFTLGTLVDWGLTAGIVGWGGTELTHSVIEGLVKGRNLWEEMKEVEAGRKSILDAKFFNDYIAPELEKRGVSVPSLRQTFETLRQAGVPADQLVGSMTAGEVDKFLEKLESRSETAQAAQAVRSLLEGVPSEKAVEVPNILNLLTPEQRQRFLGV